MDTQPGLSAQPPDSKVPTLAPSRASASDDGKVSALGDQTDVEIASADPVDATFQAEKQPAEQQNEKQDALARQATATSETGKALEPTLTREDGSEYPTGLTLVFIVLALCLSVFTMALGGQRIPPPKQDSQLNSTPRQLNHRHRHPQDHGPVPVPS